ncbi:MAG: RING finger domain-containing protein [Candidatus Hodarchaeota archaeon]
MLILEQQQKLRIISECCICRRDINTNEKAFVCPDCQTIYHHNHLSLWLKIRKKCPICKKQIKKWLVHSYTDVKDNSSLNSSTLNQISGLRNLKKKSNFQQKYPEKDFYLFECRHCGNVLNSQDGNSSIQCKACGSFISVNIHINLKNEGHKRCKSLRKKQDEPNYKQRRIITHQNREKISNRKLKLQKKVNRDIYRKELQERSQIELQQQIALSLNQEYLKRQYQERNRPQNISVQYINIKNEKINFTSKKTNFSSLILRVLKRLGRFRNKNTFNRR